MPKYVRPGGYADLDKTTEALVEHFKTAGLGRKNIVSAQEIADRYDISLAQARQCAWAARITLRAENVVLAGRPGPGGGWYIADEEEQAREYVVRRSHDALTRIENTARDSRAAINGVVEKRPLTKPFWERTIGRLEGIEADLRRVQRDLEVGTEEALEAGSR
jgi:DNA-binding IscR family transcriptional regulator